jgi:serine O-acetyltransferase
MIDDYDVFEMFAGRAPLMRRLEASVDQLHSVILSDFILGDEAELRANLYGLLHDICSFLRPFYPFKPRVLSQIHKGFRSTLDWDSLSLNQLVRSIVGLKKMVKTDIEAALANDPATQDPIEVLLCYPGIRAVMVQRIAHLCGRAEIPLLPRVLMSRVQQDTGIDIHPSAKIGSHFFIDHGTGVVIGETAEIGNHVILFQGVTLGAKKIVRDHAGGVIKHIPRHPIIGDHVTIYSGATVLGRITIGEGTIIGGNVWVTENVAPYSRITQQHFISQGFSDGGGI